MNLVIQMMVGNEGGPKAPRLKRLLSWAQDHRAVDQFIILDDASKDETIEICKTFSKVSLYPSKYQESRFAVGAGMSDLREYLWELTCQNTQEGDWVLAIDADQRLNQTFTDNLTPLKNSLYQWVGNRLLDLWTPTHYRVDGYWSPLISRLFRVKHTAFGRPHHVHAANIPAYLDQELNGVTFEDYHILHDGWIMTEEDRKKKQEFYLKMSPVGSINHTHALSITKPPVLRPIL